MNDPKTIREFITQDLEKISNIQILMTIFSIVHNLANKIEDA